MRNSPEVAGKELAPEDPSPDRGIILTLFFPDNAGRLVREDRPLPSPPEQAEGRARATLEALLAGPLGPLVSVIPTTSRLLAFYLGEEGTAYVDFDAAFARGLSRGSDDALLAVWSIANSLAVSVPEVRRTRIFVEGEEVSDLGGHLDLTRPILPDMSLVRGAAREDSTPGVVP